MLPTVGVHADLVIDAATRRAVHAVATAAAGKATTQTGEGARIISDLERQLADVARDTSQTATSLGLDALEALEAAQRGEFRGGADRDSSNRQGDERHSANRCLVHRRADFHG